MEERKGSPSEEGGERREGERGIGKRTEESEGEGQLLQHDLSVGGDAR